MKKVHGGYQNSTLRLFDPEMTCKDLGMTTPKGKIMAWSDDDIVVVKYSGFTGWTGGCAAIARKDKEEYVPSETVVYQLLTCEVSASEDGFSEITTAKAKELIRFPTRKGLYAN